MGEQGLDKQTMCIGIRMIGHDQGVQGAVLAISKAKSTSGVLKVVTTAEVEIILL
jgi:hypothetical protein